MDFGTIIGLLAGVSIIIIGILRSGGDLFWFYSLNSIIIVLVGVIAATFINYPIKAIMGLFGILGNVFRSEIYDYEETISEIV